MGRLIVFSGIDGAGKTTQIECVEEILRSRGERATRIWARGGYTPAFSFAKRVLRALRPGALPPPGRSSRREQALGRGWVRRLWLQLAIGDLMIYYGIWIRWLCLNGHSVLSDRYLADTALDFALHYPDERVERWWSWKLLRQVIPRPDAAFMLLVPVDESLRRSSQKSEPFPDSAATLAARLRTYEQLCAGGEWRRIDCTQARAAVTREIMAGIEASRGGKDRAST